MTRRDRLDLAATLGVVLLDVATKAAVAARLAPGDSIDLLGSWARLTHVRNVGAAFGLLARAEWAGPLFSVVTAAAIVGLLLFRFRAPPAAAAHRWGLHLVLGGAIGNFIDRIRLGHVVDFLDVGAGALRWPAFNVADSAITVGVLLLLAPVAASLDRSGAAEPAAAPDGVGSGAG